MNRKPWSALGIIFLVGFCLQAFLAASRLSATTDEPVHLVAGYSYWQTHDFRINPEHPPLVKLLAAAPLLAIKPALDTSSDDWKAAAEYPLGFKFLYSNDADRLLFWSRIPMIVLSALGGLITFLWARDLFGARAGAFAAGLYAFCPDLLAHGTLVTTDMAVGTFTVLSLYLFWRQGDAPNLGNSVAAGLALGAAMTSKYSGALLPFLIAALSLIRGFRQKDRKAAFIAEARTLAIMAVMCLVVVETVYLFSSSPLLYFRNSASVNANHDPNYQYYLLGELSMTGWWYYFLLAFVFKATVPTLCLLVFSIIQMRSGLISSWGETILFAAIVFYFVVMSAAADNIGIRYLLGVFPLVYIWVSRLARVYWHHRAGKIVLVLALAWQGWAALSTFPEYIPYFNELAGGVVKGPDLLDDSNVDWGESLKQVALYAKEKQIHHAVFCPFSGFENPEYYGLNATIRAPRQLVFNTPAPGTYIISAHNLAWMRTVDPVWRQATPADRVGGMWVYRF